MMVSQPAIRHNILLRLEWLINRIVEDDRDAVWIMTFVIKWCIDDKKFAALAKG